MRSCPPKVGEKAEGTTQAVVVAAGAALAALAFGAAFLAGALAAFLAGAFLTPAAFLAGVFFLVAVAVFLVLGAAFLTGVFFFVAVVGFLVEAYMAVKLVRTAFWIFSAVKAQVTVS